MADTLFKRQVPSRATRDSTAWDRLKVHRDWLGMWFMLPALAILVLFLAYPLGLGVWLSFTDARIGRGMVIMPVGTWIKRGGGANVLTEDIMSNFGQMAAFGETPVRLERLVAA